MQTERRKEREKSILLVLEPDAATRSGMKRLLEMNGFAVTAVADASEAVTVASHTNYDLILFDSNLPPPASFASAHRLHAYTELKNTPLLVISVHGKLHVAPDDLDADRFSVAYLTDMNRFDELEKLIDCLIAKK